MKFEKEVYCSFCGYAIVDVVFHTLDKEENQGHKGAHLSKVEIVAVCDECERATTNIYNNRQDFTKPDMSSPPRTSDPVHDFIQNDANPLYAGTATTRISLSGDGNNTIDICPNCGGTTHNGICAACRAIGNIR